MNVFYYFSSSFSYEIQALVVKAPSVTQAVPSAWVFVRTEHLPGTQWCLFMRILKSFIPAKAKFAVSHSLQCSFQFALYHALKPSFVGVFVLVDKVLNFELVWKRGMILVWSGICPPVATTWSSALLPLCPRNVVLPKGAQCGLTMPHNTHMVSTSIINEARVFLCSVGFFPISP